MYATTDSSNLWGTVAGVRVLGNSSNALEFVARPATNSGLNVVASDIASYTRMVISYSGNVGIGTTTDGGYKLNVTGNNYNTFVTNAPFLVDTSANNYRIANLINNPNYHSGGYANNTFDIFSVGANSSSTANGSPFFRVNLAGGSSTGYYGAAGQNQVLAQLNGVTTATLVLSAQGSGMALIGSTSINPTITTIAQGSNLNLRSDVNGSYAGGGINYFASINGSNHSHVWYFNSAEQMRLMYTGNLLLGTATDAGYKLDVNGTIRFQDHLIFSSTKGIYASTALSTVLQSSTNYFTHNRIGSSGTLGFQISVVGNVQSFWRYNDGTGDVEFGNANGSYHLGLYAGNTERVKILGNGNVGIGTTSPTAKVHVVGSGSTSATNALLIQNSAGTAALTVGDDRNTIVNGQFDVTGTSNFRVVTTTSSVKLQIGASPWMTYDATSTYFLGTDFYANAGNKNLRWGGGAVFGAVINRNGSAIVQLESTTQGFLPPRMTTAQRTAISSPAAGLCVFDTDLQNLCFFRDGVWVQVSFAAI